MLLAIALAGIVALVLLIAVARLTPFLAFLIVCIGVGLASGLGPLQVSAAIQKGLGDTLGSLAAGHRTRRDARQDRRGERRGAADRHQPDAHQRSRATSSGR